MALPVVFARVQVGNWSRCWQKDEVKPKKRKKRVEANVLFLFESFDVIHCSIWHFVLNELSWCHVTPKGAMPSSSAPKIHSPWTSPLLGWWPMEDPDFSWLWRIPPGTVGHRGHCGHHIEGGQKGCYVRWIMKIPKLKIPWFRFQGWLVSRQERPTTSSSRVRQVPKASGGFRRFRWYFFLLQFIRAHRLMEITFSKYMSTTQVQQH